MKAGVATAEFKSALLLSEPCIYAYNPLRAHLNKGDKGEKDLVESV